MPNELTNEMIWGKTSNLSKKNGRNYGIIASKSESFQVAGIIIFEGQNAELSEGMIQVDYLKAARLYHQKSRKRQKRPWQVKKNEKFYIP